MYSQSQLCSQQGISPAWAAFSQKLSIVLDGLAVDQVLILNENCSPQYVQFHARGSTGMWSETTSNFHRSDWNPLTEEQIAQLTELGWQPPTVNPLEWRATRDPNGSDNFFANSPLPLNSTALADMAVRTFAQVLHVPSPKYLMYDASASLPQLGLRRFKR